MDRFIMRESNITPELTRPRGSANFDLQTLLEKHAIAARVQRLLDVPNYTKPQHIDCLSYRQVQLQAPFSSVVNGGSGHSATDDVRWFLPNQGAATSTQTALNLGCSGQLRYQ